MAENSVMGAVTLFIAVVIIIGLTPVILGNVTSNCSNVPGYNPTTPSESTGWAKACLNSETTNQNSFNVLTVIPIVVAAVGILMVVRFL